MLLLKFYPIIKELLFTLNPEVAHDVTLNSLRLMQPCLKTVLPPPPVNSRTVMGLTFPNPVGLAAGLDKNGDCIQAWKALGFGFIEIGTVTPLPQRGQPKPRLFRVPKASALINRMGFNNRGVDYLIKQMAHAPLRNINVLSDKGISSILGINIGKQATTPIDQALADYLLLLNKVYPYADYIAVNISSPNTPHLRELQSDLWLHHLLEGLKQEQSKLATQTRRYVPIAIKIAPDLDSRALEEIAYRFITHEIDAVIATNTTLSRAGIENLPYATESGGLSGAPLQQRSTEVIQQLRQIVGTRLAIIASGGILSGADAKAKITAGADLVQIYTGLIYRGPLLIHEITQALAQSGEYPMDSRKVHCN